MRRAGPILAAAVVVLADAVALLGVARNRSGEPGAILELTERELYLPYRRKEDTGISLVLQWESSDSRYEWGPPSWFDEAKLQEIGYDCSLPLDDPMAETWYGKARTRQVHAVLEHDGESWQGWLERQEQKLGEMAEEVARREKTTVDLDLAKERLERERRTKSRLFLIDVGQDAAALRARYPDGARYIVTPALVDLGFVDRDSSDGGPYLTGSIRELMVQVIHVPRDKRAPLDAALASREQDEREGPDDSGGRARPDDEKRGPGYAATIAYGRRHEPWVVEVRSLGREGESAPP